MAFMWGVIGVHRGKWDETELKCDGVRPNRAVIKFMFTLVQVKCDGVDVIDGCVTESYQIITSASNGIENPSVWWCS